MLLENACYPHDPRVRREAQTLLSAGCEVSVICPADKGQPRREVIDGVHLYRFRSLTAGDGLLGYLCEYGYTMIAASVLSLVVLFRRGFDVVHAHNPPDLFVLIGMMYKLLGKRFVFDHHDLSPEMYYARFPGKSNRLVHRVLLLFERLSCRVADQVIATNNSYKAVEQERNGIPADRITVVRNGPEPALFQDASPDPQLRRKAGTIIGYVGLMNVQDGIDYLLRAIKHLVHDLGRTDVLLRAGRHGHGLGKYASLRQPARPGQLRVVHRLRVLRRPAELPGHGRHRCRPRSEKRLRRPLDDAQDDGIHDARQADRRLRPDGASRNRPGGGALCPRQRRAGLRPEDRRLDGRSRLARRMGCCGRQRVATELAWTYQAPHLLDAYAKVSGHTLVAGVASP